MFIRKEEYNDLIYKAKKLEEVEEELIQLKRYIKEVRKDKIEKTFKDYHWVITCDDAYNCMIYTNGIWNEKMKSFVAQQEGKGYLPELTITK